ncbi:hypothetical protein GF339_13750 [candidate division KSB3 bacterium]|uniref:CN hydrolase domain-containing protein n=1 Tax=candidate division KSB3 bacterium TaxID=2044937 RepID=A0A9D5JWM2_9BACT|nr:hypothetical protein [candidate division KSB3 bacterium]MBD3325644.1 hypothetical protein [candidate division KSB3 bacterium]
MNIKKYNSLVLFVLGFGVFVFTRMSKLVPTIPVAILIAPIFILRFIRTQPARRGIPLTLLGFIVSINIGLWGLFDIGGGLSSLVFNVLRSAVLALHYFLPYMIDRWIYPHYKKYGVASAFTFPIITTAVLFLSSLEGPFEGTIQIGKFVYGPLAGQQLLSLVGIPGYIFLSSWCASLINYLWEHDFDWRKGTKTVIAFLLIVVAIFVFGTVKLSSRNPEQETVKTAAIVLIPEDGKLVHPENFWKDKSVPPFEETMARIELLTHTAASHGAKIVSFSEFAILLHEKDVERVRAEYQRMARKQNVYLSANYAYYGTEGKGENKHLLIDHQGTILLDYAKRYLYGMGDTGETGIYRKGPEVIQSVETPYGKIAVSLCRDLEMVDYMRQAGKANVDIMLSPANQVTKDLVVHSNYMRTIEYGFSLVRPAFNGISVAVDYHGRILNQMDSDETDDGIMYAEIPTRGINTLYTTIGDIFGWICVVGLLGLLVLSLHSWKNQQ